MIDSLLATKFYVSAPGAGSVERSRLFARLNKGIDLGRKVTLISAPAGYGKTTLVSGWLNKASRPFAWVSLDEGDNDPARFFTYVIAALKSLQAGTGQSLEGMLRSPNLPSKEVLAGFLVNDIISAECRFILVLDDFHVIRNEFIHEVIQQVLDHLPSVMNLVLVTREDPPLSLAKWRARGELTEMRTGDLKFTIDETAAFFTHKSELKLNDEQITALTNRTEGWITGLQLAAISLRGRYTKNINEFIEDFNGSQLYVLDYLMEEVVSQQHPDVRDFLRRTSILDSFCASLCDEVTGRCDSKLMLTKLEQANLFLIPLDDYREVYRYHHLFTGFLRSQLTEAERRKLHERAAVWYEVNGYHEDTVNHALAAGNVNAARSAIFKAAYPMLERGQARTLLGWIDALPEQLVLNDGQLMSCKAGALFLTGQADEAAQCLIKSKNIPSDQIPAASRGRLLAIEALLGVTGDNLQTLTLAEEALKLIGDNDPLLRIFTLNTLGRAQRMTGDFASAGRTFRATLALSQKTGSSMHTAASLMELAVNLYYEGKLRAAIDQCYQAIHTDSETQNRKLSPYTGMLYTPLGFFYYETNQLGLSKEYLEKGLEAIKKLGLDGILGGDTELALARLLYATEEKESAFSLLRGGRYGINRSAPMTAFRYGAQEADFKLKEGDLDGAACWAKEAGLSPDDRITLMREQSYCIFAGILIAQKRYNDAWTLLDNLERFAREGGGYGRLIKVCILQALVRLGSSGVKDAMPYIEEAIRLATPEGYRRAFLDEGMDVAILLREARYVSPVFVDELLTALENCRFNNNSVCPRQIEILPVNGLPAKLIEPLSGRELEILRLIAVGLSNADIGRKLHVTVGTVKWHSSNIYLKMGVKTRTQAAAKARGLGLLD